MNARIPKLDGMSARPASIRHMQPNDSDSSSTSSLTYENIRLHNALVSQQNGSVLPVDHIRNQVVDTGSSSSCTSSPTPNSSNDPQIPDETSSTPFPSRLDSSTELDPEVRTRRVHFRPRVRITSGIKRHRHIHSPRTSSDRYLTPSSSRSSSPSSSISAPLRTRNDDEVDKPGWGPLGQRVALFSRDRRRTSRERRRPGKTLYDDALAASERTPLLPPRIQSPISDTEGCRERDLRDSAQDDAHLTAEVDQIFGTMPRRLLNYHWWWWKVEPVVCCTCLEESDSEF
ncbi:hypothetical protein LshimejAT787_0308810 [Lyophyllum shimeji]|uniref:Uncharacterized protein n=1 Tax=Lyophyllum shimeji TaxID=47721 RepID=A0A9P3UKE9_LYOSH|nr:hypothetical protein LshimejAT787_0308810 [Lyophyllum shimeji]